VLNLAANQITEIKGGLDGLSSLTELNLRRNRIKSVSNLGHLKKLQKFFLSNNEIKSFDVIRSVFTIKSLSELSLDGNPVAANRHYRQYLLEQIKQLRNLDLRKVSPIERKESVLASNANVLTANIDAVSSSSSSSSQLLTPTVAAADAHTTPDSSSAAQHPLHRSNDTIERVKELWVHKEVEGGSPSTLSSHVSRNSRISMTGQSRAPANSYVDVNSDAALLGLFGKGALDKISFDQRTYFTKEKYTSVCKTLTHVQLFYIKFDDAVKYFGKMKTKYSDLKTMTLGYNNIQLLSQLDALNVFQLTTLTVSDNAVIQTLFWRSYVAFRLPTVSMLNGTPVTPEEKQLGYHHFNALRAHWTNPALIKFHKLCKGSNPPTEGKRRSKKSQQQDKSNSHVSGNAPTRKVASQHRRLARSYVDTVTQTAIEDYERLSALDSVWDDLMREVISETLQEL
jgi:Leucine-rich repeat (LRR) protein